jgi:hypothetical protein
MDGGGHLFMQTNEARNSVIHYLRSADGTINESERVFTGGAGSGGYNPIINRESTPNPFEGARSVILSPDRRFLFTTNAGDNSVSSFAVGEDGRLTLLDARRTGNIVPGRSGSAKSLAYDASTGTLYVLHALGPDHLRLMSVRSSASSESARAASSTARFGAYRARRLRPERRVRRVCASISWASAHLVAGGVEDRELAHEDRYERVAPVAYANSTARNLPCASRRARRASPAAMPTASGPAAASFMRRLFGLLSGDLLE